MADVIAICGRSTNHKDVILNVGQMLLPIFWLMLQPWFMTDIVMVLWQMLLPYVCFMADVIAM